MIQLIIFDLGGVIQGLDWSPVVNSLIHLKKDLDINKYREAFYYKRKEYFDLYSVNQIEKRQFWGMVVDQLGIDRTYIDELSQSFELIYSFVNVDLLDLIKSMRKEYQIVALSNACPEIENKVMKDGIYVHLFDKLYFSHNIGKKKPSQEAYLTVVEQQGIPPEGCLFIDNDMKNILGAEQVGMNCILYKGMQYIKQEMSKKFNIKIS